jgi:ribonuclease E
VAHLFGYYNETEVMERKKQSSTDVEKSSSIFIDETGDLQGLFTEQVEEPEYIFLLDEDVDDDDDEDDADEDDLILGDEDDLDDDDDAEVADAEIDDELDDDIDEDDLVLDADDDDDDDDDEDI